MLVLVEPARPALFRLSEEFLLDRAVPLFAPEYVDGFAQVGSIVFDFHQVWLWVPCLTGLGRGGMPHIEKDGFVGGHLPLFNPHMKLKKST